MLPLVLVLVLTQDKNARSGLLKGFSLVAIALAGLSAAISGWSVFIWSSDVSGTSAGTGIRGIAPQAMANFHGLIYFFFHGDLSTGAVVLMSVLSVTALIKTLAGWKYAHLASHRDASGETQPEFDVAFAHTVVFALLVSYHLNPHDLSLLLLRFRCCCIARWREHRAFRGLRTG